MNKPSVRLIGDIGGTNARFALATDNGFREARTLPCAEFAAAEDAISHYLDSVAAPSPDAICLAAAGPVIEGTVNMTNNRWTLSVAELARAFDTRHVALLNDFEAVAWSVPSLTDSEFVAIGLPESRGLPQGNFRIAVIGPGTGLGAGGVYREDDRIVPIVGEGGHMGFSPESRVQMDIMAALREKFDRISVEHMLSGAGLENTWWALNRLHGQKRVQLSAAEIFAAARDDNEERAVEATQVFFQVLGQVAGDLALVLGAVDGVYIAGGIAKRYPEMLSKSGFRNAFEAKGKHRSMMERIPTCLIVHDEPGLLGAAYCANRLLA